MKGETKVAIRATVTAKSTLAPWVEPSWKRRKPAESKAERLQRVAAEMRGRRTKAQTGANRRWEQKRLTYEESQMTLSAIESLDRAGGTGSRRSAQGADIWPTRPKVGRHEETW